MTRRRTVRAAGFAAAAVLACSAQAPPGFAGAPFFQGKTITIVISTGVAGGYAEYARLLAAHMGAHLAGDPDFIVQSMPGAGGLVAADYLYSTAPRDGTTIGIVHSSVPLAPLWGEQGVRFKTLKFNWLGSFDRAVGMCVSWHSAPIKTWDDMLHKTFTVGSSGAGSQMSTYPAILNRLFGTKMKVISGYKSGTDVYLAMERGEVEGRCGGQLAVIKSTRPTWLSEHKINVPILIAAKRSPEFPNTPAIMEFVKDSFVRQQLQLLTLTQKLDRPVMLPPGVLPRRVAEMRAAFDATMRDPAFLVDVKKERLDVDPVNGVEMTDMLAKAFALPRNVIAAARDMMAGGQGPN